jgi:hypothetical protein
MYKKLSKEELNEYEFNKRIVVRLNGTKKNPFAIWGLRQNPFPQIGEHRYDPFDHMINSLGGEPLKGKEDIKQRLRGCSEEFIELCCMKFKKGEMVEFEVHWKD